MLHIRSDNIIKYKSNVYVKKDTYNLVYYIANIYNYQHEEVNLNCEIYDVYIYIYNNIFLIMDIRSRT